MHDDFKKFRNKNGHIVIPASRTLLVEKFKGYGICDRCNETDSEGFLIPVLGHKWYCTACKEDWEKTAIAYPEDAAYEREVAGQLCKIIALGL